MKGTSVFVDDISVPGMIHALTIRSPFARGSLEKVACPELPDSYFLITPNNIPGENRLAESSVPVLADKILSYEGQPVAILAGPERSVLEELSSRIDMSLGEETPVFYGEHTEDDIVVRRDIKTETTREQGSQDQESRDQGPGEEAIISGTYHTGIQEHWYSEPTGAVAVPSPEGKAGGEDSTVTVYTATQWPHHVMRSVAGVLGLPGKRVIVDPTLMGVHLDGKIWYSSLIACHAALAAWITGCPVKLMLTREEDFLYSPKRNNAEISISSTLGEKGAILGTGIQVKLDLGAGSFFEDEIMDHTCMGALGAYDHRSFTISGDGIRTNIPPQGPMAGFGLSQGFFAAECHASRIADSLGQDPAEWRKNNALEKSRELAIGPALKNPAPLAELIDAAAAISDYYRKWASYDLLRKHRKTNGFSDLRSSPGEPLRGIGISTAFQGNGFLYNDETGNGNCTVELTLEKDGSLGIKTSLAGTGHFAVWQNLAGEILGVDPGMVQLTTDTGEAPDAGIGTLSRNFSIVTGLIERCCTAIRKLRFRDPLPITVKRSNKPVRTPGWVPEKRIDPEAFAHPGWGAAVAEIEIDPVSLIPFIRGIWFVADGGKILSRSRACRTLQTGIIQALGWACSEQVYYHEGKIPQQSARAYDIPVLAEIPPIHVDFIRNEGSASGASKGSPKGIGDLPFCCVPAAYVQAVSQAMNYPFNKIPLNARDIWLAGIPEQTEKD